MAWEKEIKKIQEELIDKSSEIDPYDEYDWHDLCLGFLLASGVPLNVAHEILIGLDY